MSYRDGFEAATELCLKELNEADSKEKASEKLQYILSLVKEDKLEKIKQMLGTLL